MSQSQSLFVSDEIWTMFEFLHMETVQSFLNEHKQRGSSMDHCYAKLEYMGFRFGQKLIEKFSKERERLKDELEMMKYICKEFWFNIYRKNIDNLRTNHQGVYVLTDNQFRFLRSISSTDQFTAECHPFLAIPCGVLRGALANIGVSASVSSEIVKPPQVKFTVTIDRKT
ncbi:trafficking protein particle complex subunit 6b-like [Convolutriloba macropyga]|uniref:trafficking protein particle complex subunit 6b-like n=1 Tax=Convolutriloba macropyga TaxID=536237 RepID=UPI003F52095D